MLNNEHIAALYFSVTSRRQWEGEKTLGGCTAGESDWDRSAKKVLKGENGNERDWDRKNGMKRGKSREIGGMNITFQTEKKSPQTNPFFSNCHFILLLLLSKDWNTFTTDICPWALARAKRGRVATCLGKPHLYRDRQVTRTQTKLID